MAVNRLEVILSKFGQNPRSPFGYRGPGDPVVSDRTPVNKAKSAKVFRKNTSRTKAANIHEAGAVQSGPARGGIRL